MARLKALDVQGALRRFGAAHRAAYGVAFNAAGPRLSAAIDQLGVLGATRVFDEIAEIELKRGLGSSAIVFPIVFTKSSDQLWRLDGM
jgi:hypothetical protein